MQVLLLIAGVLLILVTMLDAFWTTVRLAGGGPVTRRVAAGLWRVFLRLRSGGGGVTPSAGSVILLVTIFLWIVAVLAGYLLVFSADEGAVVHGRTGAPADLAERAYFIGYTVFTLGLGDYVPGGDAWRIVTVVATLNGLFLVTLSITYILPVISAAVSKHQLAGVISSLGETPQELVLRAWDGGRFSDLGDYLVQVVPMIELHAQRHLAYPILHYFDVTERRTALAPSIATLYEAALIMRFGVAEKHRPSSVYVAPVEEVVGGLLKILGGRYIRQHEQPPPGPDLAPLGGAGIPLGSAEAFEAAVAQRVRQRTLLRGFVEHSGWEWPMPEPDDESAAASRPHP